jgi:hypothetical protein
VNSNQLTFLKIVLAQHVDRAQRARARGERGASAIEWVIITVALAAIAAAVFIIFQKKIVDKANQLNP